MDADLERDIENAIRNVPPVPKAGDTYTLGTFERAIRGLERATRDLQRPRSGDYSPKPLPEELRPAAYGNGTRERAMQNILSGNPEDCLPEPPQEELRQAVQNVRKAFGKRAFLHTSDGTLEGTLQPSDWLGVYFIHYEGRRAARHIFSQEYLKLEGVEPVYKFSAANEGCCFPLYGWENVAAKYSLWRAGVKPPTPEK